MPVLYSNAVGDIRHKWWQLSIDNGAGYVRTIADDIEQSIWIVCTTRRGTDPGRPEFGCNILDWIDRPYNLATKANMIFSLRAAISRWEPRANILAITIDRGTEPGSILVQITWVPIADGGAVPIVTPIGFPVYPSPMVYFAGAGDSLYTSGAVFNSTNVQSPATKSTGWQPSVLKFGSVVQGIADLSQAILLICTTRRGTDPGRPEFGCDMFSHFDRPLNLAGPRIANEIVAAITRWEKRVKVTKIIYSFTDTGNSPGSGLLDGVVFQIFWSLAGGALVNATSSITIGPDPEVIDAVVYRILGTETTLMPFTTEDGAKIALES